MTPGTPINFRPLWGLLAMLAGLCAVLFFACPLTTKHVASKQIRIQHFARLQPPPMLPAQLHQQPPPVRQNPMPARTPTPPMAQTCMICREPAERYLHAIQSPFPENRQTYEAPKVVNNLPPAFAYSPARPAAYARAYDNLHP